MHSKKSGKIKTEYRRNYVHTSADVDFNFAGPTVLGSVVLGYVNIPYSKLLTCVKLLFFIASVGHFISVKAVFIFLCHMSFESKNFCHCIFFITLLPESLFFTAKY